jgi:hypothetical protein
MISNGRPWEYMHCILLFLPKLETLQVEYQINPWPEPSNELYLKKYYAQVARICDALYHIVLLGIVI